MILRSCLALVSVVMTNVFTAAYASGDNIEIQAEKYKSLYVRPVDIPFPSDNPYSVEKATLGKMLFFDPRLSQHENISCASCHNPSFGWEAAMPKSVGAQNVFLPRHSPTILNMAWGKEFFWDGRAASLEEQATGPLESEIEMNLTEEELIGRISAIKGYQKIFEDVYSDGITINNVTGAIATFERTIVSGQSPFDKWVAGDKKALTQSEKAGFVVFNEKGRCSACHTGWNFTDHKYHDIGMPTNDDGRFTVDSSSPMNHHAFKTPSLRNIAQRAPYMHNGSLPNLESVIAHYISGGIPRPSRSKEMQSIPLTPQEMQDLIAFLLSLQGKDKPMALPELPL